MKEYFRFNFDQLKDFVDLADEEIDQEFFIFCLTLILKILIFSIKPNLEVH
jgi:hypothetical protein